MKIEKAMGKTVGVALFAGATAAVWFWPKAERKSPPPEPVRPVMSVVVKDGLEVPDLHFAAEVTAENSRVISFRHKGRIMRIPVDSGQQVKKGDKLAWLDPIDYENDLAKAQAAAERCRLTYQRRSDAVKRNAVSKEEVSAAYAAMKQAEAELTVAKRTLEETVLYAPFDGVVARKLAEELEIVDMVTGAKKVLILQDEENVKIKAALPETFVIGIRGLKLRNEKDEGNAFVTFDAFPDKRYPAKFSDYEATSEQDDNKLAKQGNQTFVATFVMKKPNDLLLMPGMSATLVLPGANYTLSGEFAKGRFTLPESAIGVASDGKHFVWTLEPTDEAGIFSAKRREVEFVHGPGHLLLVKSGLKGGERVATAGVNILTEGRKVSLVKDRVLK